MKPTETALAEAREAYHKWKQKHAAILVGSEKPMEGGFLSSKGLNIVLQYVNSGFHSALKGEFTRARMTGDWKDYCALECEAMVNYLALVIMHLEQALKRQADHQEQSPEP
jgi:hypothetical protein